ncbi:hypothetical protein P152DRAFT_303561 [Eremomyces bilateralis CBS 781.70]|uniref:WW domain-containing protein n=1 Tax=Eremomyces bilateralis CBS 781.70 TaxID=1392243 RepID=A0A6G1G824_9PEZI|nr:uncharacterized protein P152DRAFT_303561 [Eremomyces bilateralis CBS 781.70]KAF1814071.1 hypothetical protein P152DRAFT_303561 [Eremomyces bilateralis CBS 781.70]
MSSEREEHEQSHKAETDTPKEQDPPMPSAPARSPAESKKAEDNSKEPTSSKPSEPSEPQTSSAPPLPDEEPPAPLPDEAPPQDDGWEAVWDAAAQNYYFYNHYTKATQWENPRVPEAASSSAPGTGSHDRVPTSSARGTSSPAPRKVAGGYNPAIHGDYDPNADYAIADQPDSDEERERQQVALQAAMANAGPNPYGATGAFNRFTGKWQSAELTPDQYNDESKSRRQMNAFFDVDAAANSHDGRSLKAERQGKKLSKAEIKAFRDKRKGKKEEKRRAWLRD